MSVLHDVLVSDLRVVFCGTAAGSASAQRQAYYAGPGDAFWRTLFEVDLTPCLLEPPQYAAILIGMLEDECRTDDSDERPV